MERVALVAPVDDGQGESWSSSSSSSSNVDVGSEALTSRVLFACVGPIFSLTLCSFKSFYFLPCYKYNTVQVEIHQKQYSKVTV